MGITGATAPWACLRASIVTTAGSTEPAWSALAIPLTTEGAGRLRWASRISTMARVPSRSPSRRRASAQNRSWVALKASEARARARGAAESMAPGLQARTSR